MEILLEFMTKHVFINKNMHVQIHMGIICDYTSNEDESYIQIQILYFNSFFQIHSKQLFTEN